MKRRLLSLTSAFRMLHFLLKCETAVSWEEERQPTPYPISFRIPFFTNVSDDSDDRATVSGMLYYDWTIRSQRVDHGAGSYECVHFYNALDEPCSLFFTPSGMYRVLPDNNKTTLPCCLDLPDIGAPAPTWAESANGSYHGMVYEEYSERLAYQWTFNQVDSRNLSWIEAVPSIQLWKLRKAPTPVGHSPLRSRGEHKDDKTIISPSNSCTSVPWQSPFLTYPTTARGHFVRILLLWVDKAIYAFFLVYTRFRGFSGTQCVYPTRYRRVR
jgi:hypothetical protein